jgi:transposase
MAYLRKLREWIRKNGSQNIVYCDESGFYAESPRPHGWAKRGKKLHGLVTGNKKKGKINLIMAQRGKEWLAPMLFEKNCTHHTVNAWVEQALLKELQPNSLVIMDNAPVHNKTYLTELFAQHGHTFMPLPKYSPDFNPIEQSFAILKKQRIFSNQSLVQLLS